jgi:hypothetical protein
MAKYLKYAELLKDPSELEKHFTPRKLSSNGLKPNIDDGPATANPGLFSPNILVEAVIAEK